MNIYTFSLLGFSFGVLFVALCALFKRKDRISIRFLFFSIAVAGWGFAEALWMTENYSYNKSLFLMRLCNNFAVFIPVTWIHFVFDLIKKKEPFKFFLLSLYILSLAISLFSYSPIFIVGTHPYINPKFFCSPGPLFHAFTALFFIIVPYSFWYLIRALLVSHGEVRTQLKYVCLATITGFVFGGATFLGVYKVYFPLETLVFMLAYPLFMGLALIRYGLFDAQQIADAFQREKLAALGTMAASLNHEIRNPLFIARGKSENYFDAAERGIHSNSEGKLRACETALKETHSQLMRALDTMQRFSDFARPFKTKADSEKVMVRDAVENVLKFVSNEFALHKIQLDQSALNGVSVSVNRRQFEEILFNIILNACHAMGDKGGDLQISSRAAGKKISIEIKDSGPGMNEEQLQRIFEPFYTTKEEMGTGLGLYITKQLVERNGGRIAVHSSVGKGTKFTLEFYSR